MRREAHRLANALVIRGCKVTAAGVGVPSGVDLTPWEADGVARLADELKAVAADACRKCGAFRDENGTCWKCQARACWVCGRDSGSPFIATCCSCGNELEQGHEIQPVLRRVL